MVDVNGYWFLAGITSYGMTDDTNRCAEDVEIMTRVSYYSEWITSHVGWQWTWLSGIKGNEYEIENLQAGVMTMSPLHLKDGGHQLEIVGFVISLHIIGMYAFSPLVGVLTGKIGAKAVIGFGGLLLVVGSELASHAEPEDSLGVFMGLFLIGLGWKVNVSAKI